MSTLPLVDAAMAGTPTVGDLQFACVACSNDTAISASDGGWTDMGEVGAGTLRAHLWRRPYAGGSTWNFTSTSGNLAGVLFTVTGQDPINPLDGVLATNAGTTTGSTATVTVGPVAVDKDLRVVLFVANNQASGITFSTPAGMTSRIAGLPPAGQSRCSIYLFTEDDMPVGPALAVTSTLGSANTWVALALNVRGTTQSPPSAVRLTAYAGASTSSVAVPALNVALTVFGGALPVLGGTTVPVSLTVLGGASTGSFPVFVPPGGQPPGPDVTDLLLEWDGSTGVETSWDGATDVELVWDGSTDLEILER